MGTSIRNWEVPVGRRVDGQPWKMRFVEVKGQGHGPATALVAGIFGDKPLGCLALLELERRLAGLEMRGSVILVPAANLPALAVGTRVSPDHVFLNRRFPGTPEGLLTDQLAYRLFKEVQGRVDCIVDLHSGTPTMGLWYTYEYGDIELAASFGYLPVVVGHQLEGQLSLAATRAGIRSILPEFGGGARGEVSVGVEGCLNVLRYRAHIDGAATGPRRVPLIKDMDIFVPSTTGVLCGRYGPEDAGQPAEPGVIGWVVNVATGERLEEFVVKAPGIVMLAHITPAMVSPGGFAYMVGYPSGEVEVPTR